MFNDKEQEEQKQPVDLTTFYAKGNGDELYKITSGGKNIYIELILAYIGTHLKPNSDEEREALQADYFTQRFNLDKSFAHSNLFTIKDKKNFISFCKDFLLSCDINNLELLPINVDNYDEKELKKIEDLLLDDKQLKIEKKNNGYSISYSETDAGKRNIIKNLAKQLPEGDSLIKIFDTIDITIPNPINTYTGYINQLNINYNLTGKATLPIEDTTYKLDYYTINKKVIPHDENILIYFGDNYYKLDAANQAKIFVPGKQCDKELKNKKLLKIGKDNDSIKLLPYSKYSYQLNADTGKYYLSDYTQGKQKLIASKTTHSNIIKYNDYYYGIGSLSGLTIKPHIGLKASDVDDKTSNITMKTIIKLT